MRFFSRVALGCSSSLDANRTTREKKLNLTRAYRALISGLALLLLAAVVPTAASAATCGDDGTTQLFDPVGQYFDFTQATATASHDDPFATLYDSGGNGPADTPPGPRSNSDTYDDWGALFVGGDGVSNMYFSADNDSCSSEEGGAEHVYPVVNLGGLQVQRKIYVHPNTESGGLPGARILNLFTNPGTTPVTTTVQIGDMKSADNEGDLGSDADTAVRSSSSGDTVAAVGDQWFVTSDHSNAAGTENSDPAIAHVMDGPGGLQAVSTVLVGGGTDPSQPQDNVAWRWQITVQPGETAALMSFEAQADVATGGADQATQADALARSRAERYLTEAPAQVYAGMSPAEVSALRNWNDLELAANLTTARKQKLRKKFVATANCPRRPAR